MKKNIWKFLIQKKRNGYVEDVSEKPEEKEGEGEDMINEGEERDEMERERDNDKENRRREVIRNIRK